MVEWGGKEVSLIAGKGFKYAYQLESRSLDEVSEVCWAYTMTSHWKQIGLVPPDEGIPTHVVFEWQGEGPPHYPRVNWP